MRKFNKYFESVKEQCIRDCKRHTFEEVAKNAFSKPEVIDLFLTMEKKDQAYSFVINLIKNYSVKNRIDSIYIPGGGVGGLARRIAEYFSGLRILQVDCSKEMVATNKNLSKKYKNIIVKKGDILNFKLKPNSLNCIIAYGVMRYIPKSKRNILLDSWIRALVPGGVAIVGEGRGKDIIYSLNPQVNFFDKSSSKQSNLFRCSLFYLLCKKYSTDKIFRNEVEKLTDSRKNFADILKDLAGFVSDKVYIREFRKI